MELSAEYQKGINTLILSNLRIVILLTAPLIVIFTFLDRVVYPDHISSFFKIRLINCVFLTAMYGLSFLPSIRKRAEMLANVSALSAAITVLVLIYLSDGAQSLYYQGVNLAIMALVLVNSFNYRNNLLMCALVFALYTLTVILCPAPWNMAGYFFGSFFIVSNSIMITILTALYEYQYRQTFLTNVQLKKLYDQADELSKMDDLTKVYNRRHFMQLLEEKMERSRLAQSTFFVVFFDVDKFKTVNDTYGHLFGDTVLKTVVERVRSKIRCTNLMGRYGGDEFIFFLDLADAETFMERIKPVQLAVKNISIPHNGGNVAVSVSFGCVKVSPGRFKNVTEVTDAADQALLEVKKTQRGEIRLVE